jgi:hypothetical protein
MRPARQVDPYLTADIVSIRGLGKSCRTTMFVAIVSACARELYVAL